MGRKKEVQMEAYETHIHGNYITKEIYAKV